MTISYDALDTSIECRAIREGVPIGTAAMRTFALAAMAVAVDIPISLRPALVAVEAKLMLTFSTLSTNDVIVN